MPLARLAEQAGLDLATFQGHPYQPSSTSKAKFSHTRGGLHRGPPEQWGHELLAMVLEHGFSTFSLTSADPQTIQPFGEEVASALREPVTRERQLAGATTDVVLRGLNALALRRGASTTGDLSGSVSTKAIEPGDKRYGTVRPPTPVPGHRDW